jgi:zinc-binding alcohol dehydrogenase/oxidoreductase
MRALVLESLHVPWVYKDIDAQPVPEGEVNVALKAASLNRRDWWISVGMYPNIRLPVVLGSDGAGVYRGKRVIMYPIMKWGEEPRYQSADTEILGMPRHGTFAEEVSVPAENLFEIPDHLTFEEAASFPLAGVTAYRCLFTVGNIKPGEKILVSGIGGGVACFVALFAIAAGAEVWVTSSMQEKIDRGVGIGCQGGILYTQSDWESQLKTRAGLFDVIVDSTGGPHFHKFLKICKRGARIVIYGGTQGPITSLPPYSIFWKQIAILGTSLGTREEFQALLDMISRHKIKPIIDSIYPLSKGYEACGRMRDHLQMGKIILSIEGSS